MRTRSSSSSDDHITRMERQATRSAISAAMMSLSLQIVARTLFHTQVTDDIRRINDEVNAIMEIYNFLIAFPRMEAVLDLPFPVPIRRSTPSAVRALCSMKSSIDSSANIGPAEDQGDLLSMLISSATRDGSALSDTQIRDEVLHHLFSWL